MNFLNPAENPTGFTIFIILVTLVPIVGSFVWRQKWQRTLLTGGIEGGSSATGIITGIGQSGMEINGQPQLTFTVQVRPSTGGAPYEAHIKQTIPQMALGMLAPGRQVALVVSPKNPSKVKIDLQGTANLAAVAGAASSGFAPPGAVPGLPTSLGGAQVAGVRSNDELVSSTDAVPATVASMQETGQMYGSDPIVILTLQVQGRSGPYQVQGGYRVPLDRRPRLMPGTVVRAHPDPSNPQAVGIDWRAL
jgi:hypothetical protein